MSANCNSLALTLLSAVIITANSLLAAEHLEIQVQLNTTWRSQTQTNKHEITATCVLGTNDWYIGGQFLQNARVDYWQTETSILERQIINSGMYLEQAKDLLSEKVGGKPRKPVPTSYPKKGTVFMRTNSWLEPFGTGVERVVWLAFCSGKFLRTPGRQIPLLIGHFNNTKGYTDMTVLPDDQSALSTPKSMKLFSTNGTLVSTFEIVTSTNIMGCSFPLEFRLTQFGNGHPGSTSQYFLLGKVTSIRRGEMPPFPERESTPAK
jgi:hypothetical protein